MASTMGSIHMLLAALLIVAMSTHAWAQCASSDIHISQRSTGKTIQSKPEFEVTIEKACTCNAYGLNLVCTGFQTVENIDPNLFRVNPGSPSFCLINNGQTLPPSPDTISFTYAWDTEYNFTIGAVFFRCTMAQCKQGSLDIAVSKTGRIVGGKTEWEVKVTNPCVCSQTDLLLNCPGFSTVEQVDPAIFRKVDNSHCLVKDGTPIYPQETVTFNYAADANGPFSYSSSNVHCS